MSVARVLPEPDRDRATPADEPALVEQVSPTAPVEATLKILLASVPYLIGAAVVRQQEGAGTVVAEVGRVPWLFDRRLTKLELSEDTLPPNQAELLDWPVPHQAEWVGVPPRLLIARLVAFEKTVGVLLATLITREQLEPRAHDALDLSCELIASAVATDALVRAGDRQSRRLRVLNELQRSLSSTLEARALGRVLRDTVSDITEVAAFAASLFHPQREEVVYRYRVADVDALSNELGRQPVDDGPTCRAILDGGRVAFTREIDAPPEADGQGRTARYQVHVLQVPMVADLMPIGVVTLQTFRAEGFSAEELELVEAVVETSANYFAHARRLGLLLKAEEPQFTFTPTELPDLVAPVAQVAPAPEKAGPTPTPLRAESALVTEATSAQNVDEILRRLLVGCASRGRLTAFVVLHDDASGLLRGHLASASETMRELDEALGITRGSFVIGMEDRSNAIARACREARVVEVAWIYELVQPLFTWQETIVFERLAHGGRSAIFPIEVSGEVVGALVVGPSADEFSAPALDEIALLVGDAARDLAAALRAAPPGGA